MNDNNYNNMYNSTTGNGYNDMPNQMGNMYDLNQPPAELNNTPSMFEYQNNLGDMNNQPVGYDMSNNYNTNSPVMPSDYLTSNNMDQGNNYAQQDDGFVSFGREDYINNYNKPKYDSIDSSDYETSFESQLANSQNIYNDQSNYQQQMFNQQNFNQGYNQNYMYNQQMYNQQMYNQPLYNGINTNMNNNMNMNGPSADEITTIQRKKERDTIVRQDGLGNAINRSSGGSGIITKIFLALFYIVVIGAIAFFGYKFYLSNQKFYFNKNRIVMMIDSTYTPKVYSEGKLENNKDYSWKSVNDNIVKVNDTGEITAVGKGRTKIEVINRKTGNMEIINVEVINPDIKQLEITEDEKNLKVKEKYTLVPLINGRTDVIAKYTWTTNDDTVAVVDENGVVTGVGEGRTKIILTIEDSELSSEISIVVTE